MPNPAPIDTSDPARRAELDRLHKAYLKQMNEATGEALVRFIFGLDRWFFVGTGPITALEPWYGPIHGRTMVAAFTDADLAYGFAAAHDITSTGKSLAVIEETPADAVGIVEKLMKKGAEAVVFNQDVHGVGLTRDMLAECRQFLRKDVPPLAAPPAKTARPGPPLDLAKRNRVIRRHARKGEGVALTLDEFFDGNTHDQSIAPNLSRSSSGHPGIRVFHDTLLALRSPTPSA